MLQKRTLLPVLRGVTWLLILPDIEHLFRGSGPRALVSHPDEAAPASGAHPGPLLN